MNATGVKPSRIKHDPSLHKSTPRSDLHGRFFHYFVSAMKPISNQLKDMSGKKFNRLTAVSYSHTEKGGNAMWHCTCECGGESVVSGSALRNGTVRSCGCIRAASKMTLPYYTYIHKRGTDGLVFYVGMSRKKYRINEKASRSQLWKSIFAAHGRTAEVVSYFSTEQEAANHEKHLIAYYKSIDAPLCNITEGGKGALGRAHTDDAKRRISEAHKGLSMSEENRLAMSIRNTGKRLSPEHKARLSAAMSGEKNPQFGRAGFFSGRHHTEETKQKLAIANRRP